MEFTFYSIGDAHYLSEVLNAIAAMMYSGTGFSSKVGGLVAVGFLIGGLLVFIQAVFQGGRINFQHLMGAWLVFMVLFSETATVNVEDAQGNVLPVGGVPLGVAASTSIVTAAGYSLTDTFEQGFSTPSMLHQGYGSSLNTLKKVRVNFASPAGYADLVRGGRGPKADFMTSWNLYATECLQAKLLLNDRAELAMIASDVEAAANFDSMSYGTHIYDGTSADGVDVECKTAADILIQWTNDDFYPAALNGLSGVMGIPADDVENEINNALAGLGIPVSAKQFVVATVIQSFVFSAMRNRYEEAGAFATASAFDDAVRQRNEDWNAEAGMFMSSIDAMVTFVEGFAIAITPIMAFLVTLGPIGVGLAAKYLLLLVWIQLWTPALAIVNLYLHFTAAGKFAALRDAGVNFLSMQGLDQLDSVGATYWAVGQHMAASVPVLTLFIVTGSMITLNSVAQTLKAADSFDEKRVAPSAYNATPLVSYSSPVTHTQPGGWHRTDMDRALASINVGSTLSDSASSAQSVANSRMAAFGQELSKGSGREWSQQDMDTASQILRQTNSSSGSHSISALRKQAEGISENDLRSVGVTRDETTQMAAEISAGVKAFGTGGTVNTSFLNNLKGSDQAKHDFMTKMDKLFSKDEGWKAEYQKAVAHDVANGKQQIATVGRSENETNSLRESAQTAVTAQETAEKSQQQSRQIGSSLTWTASVAAKQTEGKDEDIRQALYSAGLYGAADKFIKNYDYDHGGAGSLAKEFGGNNEAAFRYAGLMTLAGNNHTHSYEDGQRQKGANALAGIVGQVSGVGAQEGYKTPQEAPANKPAGAGPIPQNAMEGRVVGGGGSAAPLSSGNQQQRPEDRRQGQHGATQSGSAGTPAGSGTPAMNATGPQHQQANDDFRSQTGNRVASQPPSEVAVKGFFDQQASDMNQSSLGARAELLQQKLDSQKQNLQGVMQDSALSKVAGWASFGGNLGQLVAHRAGQIGTGIDGGQADYDRAIQYAKERGLPEDAQRLFAASTAPTGAQADWQQAHDAVESRYGQTVADAIAGAGVLTNHVSVDGHAITGNGAERASFRLEGAANMIRTQDELNKLRQ